MLLALLATAFAATTDPFVGTWGSLAMLTMEFAPDGSVTLYERAVVRPCVTPTRDGDVLVCTTSTSRGTPVRHTFRLVDGVLLHRFDAPDEGQVAVAYTRMSAEAALAAAGKREERAILGVLDAIDGAQKAHHVNTGAYLALPPWPRATSKLDGRSVPLDAAAMPEAWRALGVRPSVSATAATFWVELATDGTFTAHGMADLDGDGMPQHWTLSAGQLDATRRSSAGVR